jgi:hypothetical protein
LSAGHLRRELQPSIHWPQEAFGEEPLEGQSPEAQPTALVIGRPPFVRAREARKGEGWKMALFAAAEEGSFGALSSRDSPQANP